MKRILGMALVAGLFVSAVSAYNPPAGWEGIYELSSPSALSGEITTAGGGIYGVGPESLTVNPALTATEQRVVLNLAGTALFSSNDENAKKFGMATQAGILIPTKMFIYSAYMNGTFVPFEEMCLSNNFSAELGLSKSVTDWLDIGLGMNGGVVWGTNTDWALGADLGFVAKPGNVAFMKDFRYGVSIMNLGKNVNFPNEESGVPVIGTLRGGVAAVMFKNDTLKIGSAMDLIIPNFQNLIMTASANVCLKDMFTVTISDKFNLKETLNQSYNFIPSIGMDFKFTFGIKNKTSAEAEKEDKFAAFMAENDWTESEMTVSAAYKNLYKSVNAISAGVDINLGLKDNVPPVVNIVFDDEEE